MPRRRRTVAQHARLRSPHPLGQLATLIAVAAVVAVVSAIGVASYTAYDLTSEFVDEAVAVAFARRDVDAALAVDLSHGRPLPPAGLPGTYGVFAPDDHAVALVTERDGLARPVVVLAPA